MDGGQRVDKVRKRSIARDAFSDPKTNELEAITRLGEF